MPLDAPMAADPVASGLPCRSARSASSSWAPASERCRYNRRPRGSAMPALRPRKRAAFEAGSRDSPTESAVRESAMSTHETGGRWFSPSSSTTREGRRSGHEILCVLLPTATRKGPDPRAQERTTHRLVKSRSQVIAEISSW
jgi:hypothetical protein